MVAQLSTIEHFSYSPVESAEESLSDCTLSQALEISAIACLVVGKKAAELKLNSKPKEFSKKLTELGLSLTEVNKYIKLHSCQNLESLAALGASMLFNLSAPRYEEVRSLIVDAPINQVNAIAVKKDFSPKPKRKKKVECGWSTDRGGSNRKLSISASLPAGTLNETPGVAEWVEKKYKQSGNIAGVLLDCYKDSTRIEYLESRLAELEALQTYEVIATEDIPTSTVEQAAVPDEAIVKEQSCLEAQDIEAEIKFKIQNSKSVFDPYYQIFKLACGLKSIAAMPERKADYEKNLELLKTRAQIEAIWFDQEELINNHRLLFVPAGEDFTLFKEEIPQTQDTANLLSEMKDERPIIKDEHQIERFAISVVAFTELGSIGWERIASMASKDSSQLSKICKGIDDSDKIALRQCLATYLVENPSAIKEGHVDWLHHAVLGGALKLLDFEVNGVDCTFNSIFSFKEKGLESWNFNSRDGKTINCDRNQFKIIGFQF